jgi:hypothetical protein
VLGKTKVVLLCFIAMLLIVLSFIRQSVTDGCFNISTVRESLDVYISGTIENDSHTERLRFALRTENNYVLDSYDHSSEELTADINGMHLGVFLSRMAHEPFWIRINGDKSGSSSPYRTIFLRKIIRINGTEEYKDTVNQMPVDFSRSLLESSPPGCFLLI